MSTSDSLDTHPSPSRPPDDSLGGSGGPSADSVEAALQKLPAMDAIRDDGFALRVLAALPPPVPCGEVPAWAVPARRPRLLLRLLPAAGALVGLALVLATGSHSPSDLLASLTGPSLTEMAWIATVCAAASALAGDGLGAEA